MSSLYDSPDVISCAAIAVIVFGTCKFNHQHTITRFLIHHTYVTNLLTCVLTSLRSISFHFYSYLFLSFASFYLVRQSATSVCTTSTPCGRSSPVRARDTWTRYGPPGLPFSSGRHIMSHRHNMSQWVKTTDLCFKTDSKSVIFSDGSYYVDHWFSFFI